MYKLLVYKTVSPKSQAKWDQLFQNLELNWKIIYNIPKICCKNTKLHWFQYRILHRILATNDLLTKMNIKQNNLCTFCNEEKKNFNICSGIVIPLIYFGKILNNGYMIKMITLST